MFLLIKFTIIIGFFPFFNFQAISISIKAPLAFYLAVLFFPITPQYDLPNDVVTLSMFIVFEVLSGFLVALVLRVVFDTITYVSELVSMTMGLSAAAMFDPLTQNQSTVVGQIFSLFVMLTFLSFDGHHLMLLFADQWISRVPLGSYLFSNEIFIFITQDLTNLFIFGFSIAFPVIAVGFFSDIVFGMLMKTMPQFNVFVIGMPIKVGLGLITLILVLSSMLIIFENIFLKAFNKLEIFLI